MKRVGVAIALIALSAGWAMARQSQLAAPDRDFVMDAAQGGMAEVRKGQMATDHASADAVKQFGERMVKDHSKANDELTQLAQRKGVDLPRDLDAKHQAMVDTLSRLSGAAFDRAYMSDMVRDHVEDVAAFQREARRGQDADIRAWAAKTLPTLREHLRMARMVAGQAGPVERTDGAGTGESKK